jgi:uncharacterized protein YkwD
VPDSEFCTSVASRNTSDRAHEDELLELIQQARANGATCGEGSAAAPPLRLDASLLCAARVFAIDVARTRASSLVDSAGRNTQARMALAGYPQNYWAEVFTFDAASASAALATWLAKSDLCSQLLDPKYADVGLGSAGSTYVVTLGTR